MKLIMVEPVPNTAPLGCDNRAFVAQTVEREVRGELVEEVQRLRREVDLLRSELRSVAFRGGWEGLP